MKRFAIRNGVFFAAILLVAAAAYAASGSTATNLGTIGYYKALLNAKAAAYTVNATATATASDCGTIIPVTVSSTVAVTLPNNGVIGCAITVVQTGTAKVTFTAASGATLLSPHAFTGTFAQGSIISAVVLANSGGAAAQWVFSGDGS